MDLVIPEDVLDAAHISAEELRQEIAVLLFERERLTLGQAARIAAMSQHAFQKLLATREVAPHYDVQDLDEDVATLRELGRL